MHLAVSLLGYAPPARPWHGDYCAGILPPLLARAEVTRATLLVTPYGYRHWQHLASDCVKLQRVEGLDERKRRRFYAERYILPAMLRDLRPDAVFAPLGGALLQPAARYVYRLASLAYLQEPERFSLLEQLFYGKTIPASCRVADCVVVDYPALATVAADRALVAKERIAVVASGYAPVQRVGATHASTENRSGSSTTGDARVAPTIGRYVVLLGGDDDPQLPKMLSGLTAHARLPRGWEDTTFVCLTRQAGAVTGPRVLAIEEAPPGVYRDLLAGAQLALCLTAGDSGLAGLRHALAAGLPVIAADTPATRDIAGDSAVYVPPYELAETASVLAVLLADETQRSELAEQSTRLGQGRGWDEAAQQIAAILRQT
jgi:hypothetical protein